MAISTTSYVTGALVLIIASGFVLTSGQNTTTTVAPSPEDECNKFSKSCEECLNITLHPQLNCSFEYSEPGTQKCGSGIIPAETGKALVNITQCATIPKPFTPDNSTTTTPAPNTTTTTTTPSPTTKPTTIPTTTPAPKTTNGTTTVPTTTIPTTTAPPNSTTTAAPPSNSTTTAVPTSSPGTTTTAAPSHGGGGMSWASFFGGIVFTAAVSSVGYLVWRFYKARQERNYHTLTTNLI